MDPQDRAAVEASWRSPAPSPLTVRWHQPGGTVWTELRAVGMRDSVGAVIAVEGILRDVTSQVLADAERERLDRELRQADRLDSLGRLAGGIAHDFNNLLAVILAYASDVTESLAADHPGQPDMQMISQAAERAAALTRQLLIFSRLEPSQPETLNLNDIVADIKQLPGRTIGEDIEFLVDAADDLYPVTIDRGKIEQVIMNLVMNSRAAMPEGGRLRIETANVPPQGVSLVVTDTGSGMIPEVAQRAFEPFFTTKAPGQGTGVGRAILVVEDDDAVRNVVTRMLTRGGFRVITAATPKEALEISADSSLHIDALLTDVVMPEMSGVQLAERIREDRQLLPVLLMSGYTAGSLPSGPDAAADLPLIRKPFDAATLLNHLHELVR